MKKSHAVSMAMLVAALLSSSADAYGPGDAFTWQGQLKSGSSLVNDLADIRVTPWDALVGGGPLAPADEHLGVSVVDGLFSVDLDLGPIFGGGDVFLAIEVRVPAGIGGYTPLGGRQKVMPVPYAIYARNLGAGGLGSVYADPVDFTSPLNTLAGNGASITKLNASNVTAGNLPITHMPTGGAWSLPSNLNIDSGTMFIDSAADRVGIGSTTPGYPLHVESATSAGSDNAIYGVLSNPTGGLFAAAVRGANMATNNAGVGVYGSHASGGYGVYGTSVSGAALAGQSTAAGGAGLAVWDNNTTGTSWGISAASASTEGRAVVAAVSATSGTNYGLLASTGSPDGYAGHFSGGRNYFEGNVGMGTDMPVWPLHVEAPGTGVGDYAIYAELTNTTGGGGSAAIHGWSRDNTNFGTGVFGRTDGDGFGIHGLAPNGWGVYGNSNFARGVYGYSLSGEGVYGQTTSGNAGYFRTDSASATNAAIEVVNIGTATSAYGLLAFQTNPTDTPAIVGSNIDTDGWGIGVRGEGRWRGVYGFADGGGVVSRYGVYGYGFGSAGTNYGVYGRASGATINWAGYFFGDTHVTGTLSKGAGAFRIDHPLDPENKELWHSFVESPDMMNIYNGNVVTDSDGYATVTMPEWFDALNRDFRYQLTVIDDDPDSFVLAKVLTKISDNAFTIRTSEPWTEVSWQVTGVRQDAFAQANRIPTEVEKREEDRGLYLHPEAWGMPPEKGIDYRHTDEHRAEQVAQREAQASSE